MNKRYGWSLLLSSLVFSFSSCADALNENTARQGASSASPSPTYSPAPTSSKSHQTEDLIEELRRCVSRREKCN
jgi:hypothetical protein